jgi:predicted ATP-dependent serine protease
MRPRLYTEESECTNCGDPYPVALGLCSNCYQYKRRTGKDRPAKFAGARARRNYRVLQDEQERQMIEGIVEDAVARHQH